MVPYGRKSGTENLKEEQKSKKKMIRGSLKEYQILLTRTSSRNLQWNYDLLSNLQKSKSLYNPLHSFLFTKWGKICQKGSFFKSILAVLYHFSLTD